MSEAWPADRIARLKARYERGETFEEIGRAMGFTRSGIAGKVRRLKLTRVKPAKPGPVPPPPPPEPFWTAERVELLKTRFAAGDSYAAIGRALGVSRNTACGKCHRLGLERSARISDANNRHASVSRAPTVARAPSTGNGANFGKTRAGDPGLSAKRDAAWAALPGSTPRPWTERRFTECSWPVDDGLSCCLPAVRFGWCKAHAARGRVAPNRRAA